MEPTQEKNISEENAKSDWNEMYTALITKAPYDPVSELDLTPVEEIPWIDKDLISHGMKFHLDNLFVIIFSSTFSQVMGFSVKPISTVLSKTGKYLDSEKSFKRYLSTIQRIAKFFLFQADPDKSNESLNFVRRTHSLAGKHAKREKQSATEFSQSARWKTELALAIRQDLAYLDTSQAPKEILAWGPAIPINQFNMAMTQFGGFVTLYMFPEVFGIQVEELKGVIHIWAIFGRLLGIKDEYNICINPDPKLFKNLYKNVLLQSLKETDETVITIQSTFMKAFTKRLPFIIYKAMVFSALGQLEGFKGENLWSLMSWGDKLSFYFMQFWRWVLIRSRIFRWAMNGLTVLWLRIMFWLHLNTPLFEKY